MSRLSRIAPFVLAACAAAAPAARPAEPDRRRGCPR